MFRAALGSGSFNDLPAFVDRPVATNIALLSAASCLECEG